MFKKPLKKLWLNSKLTLQSWVIKLHLTICNFNYTKHPLWLPLILKTLHFAAFTTFVLGHKGGRLFQFLSFLEARIMIIEILSHETHKGDSFHFKRHFIFF